MILQTRAKTLVMLMATDRPHVSPTKIYDLNVLGFSSDPIDPPNTISNDRTPLKHHKHNDT